MLTVLDSNGRDIQESDLEDIAKSNFAVNKGKEEVSRFILEYGDALIKSGQDPSTICRNYTVITEAVLFETKDNELEERNVSYLVSNELLNSQEFKKGFCKPYELNQYIFFDMFTKQDADSRFTGLSHVGLEVSIIPVGYGNDLESDSLYFVECFRDEEGMKKYHQTQALLKKAKSRISKDGDPLKQHSGLPSKEDYLSGMLTLPEINDEIPQQLNINAP